MGQFEWESSNLHVSYPFEQPGAVGLNDAFADAVVMDTAQGTRVKLQSLSVTSWDASGVTADVRYLDGTPFFAGSPGIQVDTYGSWAIIILAYANKEVQLIMNTAHDLPINLAGPVNFTARVQECDPKSVQTITVEDGVTNITHVLHGDIVLKAGYNTSIATATTNVSTRPGGSGLVFNAIPGAGEGVSPSNCAPAAVLRSINTVGPDELGHFVLNVQNCYRCIVPSVGGSPSATNFDPLVACLQFCNDCSQCCKCGDYENVYKAISRLHDKGRNTGLRMARTIDDLNDLKKEVNRQKDMREVPTMTMLLRPTPGYIMGVQVNLLNNPTINNIDMFVDAIENILVKMFVTSPDVSMDGAKIIPQSCYLYNARYGNPWVRVKPDEIFFQTPVDFMSTDGIGLFVKFPLVPNKFYNIIKTTQHLSMFFEIFWPDTLGPEDGDTISVRLESDVFKPYNLTKTEVLIKPFDGTVE